MVSLCGLHYDAMPGAEAGASKQGMPCLSADEAPKQGSA